MSDQSDSQNREEEQIHMSEGTSPSSSSDEGSRSTPSNLPKAATRQRRKKNSESKDEDNVAAEEEVNSKKKKVIKNEFGTAASTKPGMHKKAPAKRVPMSKARASTLGTSRSIEEASGEGKKRKERATKLWPKSLGDAL